MTKLIRSLQNPCSGLHIPSSFSNGSENTTLLTRCKQGERDFIVSFRWPLHSLLAICTIDRFLVCWVVVYAGGICVRVCVWGGGQSFQAKSQLMVYLQYIWRMIDTYQTGDHCVYRSAETACRTSYKSNSVNITSSGWLAHKHAHALSLSLSLHVITAAKHRLMPMSRSRSEKSGIIVVHHMKSTTSSRNNHSELIWVGMIACGFYIMARWIEFQEGIVGL